jgi:small nuclear ribonucleoprotein (snRNP)-like protein
MANMTIKRSTSTQAASRVKRDWPHAMSKVAYLCAALAIVLVFVQLNLYCMRFNKVYNSNVVSAVTMTNGQTYFGRLEKFGPHTVVLFDVYYLQVNAADSEETTIDDVTTDSVADTTTNDSNVKLVKLADDFYQPNNYVILNRDQIVYWQQLSNSSPIIAAINDYEDQSDN